MTETNTEPQGSLVDLFVARPAEERDLGLVFSSFMTGLLQESRLGRLHSDEDAAYLLWKPVVLGLVRDGLERRHGLRLLVAEDREEADNLGSWLLYSERDLTVVWAYTKGPLRRNGLLSLLMAAAGEPLGSYALSPRRPDVLSSFPGMRRDGTVVLEELVRSLRSKRREGEGT